MSGGGGGIFYIIKSDKIFYWLAKTSLAGGFQMILFIVPHLFRMLENISEQRSSCISQPKSAVFVFQNLLNSAFCVLLSKKPHFKCLSETPQLCSEIRLAFALTELGAGFAICYLEYQISGLYQIFDFYCNGRNTFLMNSLGAHSV